MRARFGGIATILLVGAVLAVAAASVYKKFIQQPASGAVLTQDTPSHRWAVSGTPIFDVGAGPDTLHQLYRVVGAIRLDDGRVVVANGATELRFYGSDERYLKTVGRPGAGPGEFRQIYLLRHTAGDSILVNDDGAGRLTIYTADGTVGRSTNARPWGDAIVDHDAAGGFIAGPVFVSLARPAPNVTRMTYSVERITPQGTVANVIAKDLTEDSYVTRHGAQVAIDHMLFAAPMSVAAGHGRVYVATRPAYYVAVFARDGSPLPPIQRAGSPRNVTDGDLGAYIEDHLARVTSQHTRDVARRHIEQMPRSAVMPEIARLVTDEAGNLWVQDFAISTRAPSTWTVYSTDGRPVSAVTLPPRFTPQQIGDDWVLGIQLDADDVQHVVEYQLVK